jgi:CDP-4-dehydro-6-deoxyglucose reductase
LKQLETEVPDFHFLPTYSRESADNHLLQRTGYVHAVYEEFILNNRVQAPDGSGLQLTPAAFFLCGWKQMIDQAREKIQALGYDKKAIHFELYG